MCECVSDHDVCVVPYNQGLCCCALCLITNFLFPQLLYRGIVVPASTNLLEFYQSCVGHQVMWSAFSSTSVLEDVAIQFVDRDMDRHRQENPSGGSFRPHLHLASLVLLCILVNDILETGILFTLFSSIFNNYCLFFNELTRALFQGR